MPTYERTPEFLGDLRRLTPLQRHQFEIAVKEMNEDLSDLSTFIHASQPVHQVNPSAGSFRLCGGGSRRHDRV